MDIWCCKLEKNLYPTCAFHVVRVCTYMTTPTKNVELARSNLGKQSHSSQKPVQPVRLLRKRREWLNWHEKAMSFWCQKGVLGSKKSWNIFWKHLPTTRFCRRLGNWHEKAMTFWRQSIFTPKRKAFLTPIWASCSPLRPGLFPSTGASQLYVFSWSRHIFDE